MVQDGKRYFVENLPFTLEKLIQIDILLSEMIG